MNIMNNKSKITALAAATLFSLSACGSDAEGTGEESGQVGTQTLAALVENSDDLSVISDILGNAGLQGVFDGTASYTILAPNDAAFSSLDIPLDGEDSRAARVAIVREHIVPGYLSREDIEAAIGRSGGSVEMQTMGSNTLTFSEEGDTLRVSSSDGTEATVSGEVVSGANGSVIPIDAVLKSMDQPQ